MASGAPSSRSACSAFMRSGDCAYLFTARLTFLSRARCSRPSLENRLNTPMALYRAGVYTWPPGGSTPKWPSSHDGADAFDQAVETQRLAQAVEVGVDGGGGEGREADDGDGGQRVVAALRRPEGEPVHARHHQVQDDHVGPEAGLQAGQRRLAVPGRLDGEPFIDQKLAQRLADVAVVVDDEH